MSAARTLTDADVEAIATRVAELIESPRTKPAEPPKNITISPAMQAAARAELERRGLRDPRRR